MILRPAARCNAAHRRPVVTAVSFIPPVCFSTEVRRRGTPLRREKGGILQRMDAPPPPPQQPSPSLPAANDTAIDRLPARAGFHARVAAFLIDLFILALAVHRWALIE